MGLCGWAGCVGPLLWLGISGWDSMAWLASGGLDVVGVKEIICKVYYDILNFILVPSFSFCIPENQFAPLMGIMHLTNRLQKIPRLLCTLYGIFG